MNKTLLRKGLSTLAATLVGSLAIAQQAPRWHVLLVGVDHYRGNAFPSLPGSDLDVKEIASALERSWRVPPASVKLLTGPAETTKENILTQFNNWIINPATPGDIVVFAFCGHGSQVPDPHKGSLISEVILPTDAACDSSGDLSPQTTITGPEIGKLLDELKGKGVANVTLFFDSCNSGSVTRGLFTSRGFHNPAVDRAPGGQARLLGESNGYVSMSAARFDQEARETPTGGVFTHALVKALTELANQKPTYESLYFKVRDIMARAPTSFSQEPVIEGEERRKLFSDDVSPQTAVFGVTVVNGKLQMDGGALQLVTPKSRFAIFGPGQDVESSDPIAYAFADNISDSSCDLTLDSEAGTAPHSELLRGCQAVLVQDGDLGHQGLLIATSLAAGSPFTKVKNLPYVNLVTEATPTSLVLTKNNNAGWSLRSSDGTDLGRFEESDAGVDDLAKTLKAIAKSNLICSLGPSPGTHGIQLKVRLVPVRCDQEETMTGIAGSGGDLPQDAKLQPGDHFAVQVCGSSQGINGWDPYCAIIGATPTHQVQNLWPDPTATHEMSKVLADGKWHWLCRGAGYMPENGTDYKKVETFSIDPQNDGFGRQILKVIATRQYVDFSALISSDPKRGVATSPLETLLAGGQANLTVRGPKSLASEWVAVTRSVTGVPKN